MQFAVTSCKNSAETSETRAPETRSISYHSPCFAMQTSRNTFDSEQKAPSREMPDWRVFTFAYVAESDWNWNLAAQGPKIYSFINTVTLVLKTRAELGLGTNDLIRGISPALWEFIARLDLLSYTNRPKSQIWRMIFGCVHEIKDLVDIRASLWPIAQPDKPATQRKHPAMLYSDRCQAMFEYESIPARVNAEDQPAVHIQVTAPDDERGTPNGDTGTPLDVKDEPLGTPTPTTLDCSWSPVSATAQQDDPYFHTLFAYMLKRYHGRKIPRAEVIREKRAFLSWVKFLLERRGSWAVDLDLDVVYGDFLENMPEMSCL